MFFLFLLTLTSVILMLPNTIPICPRTATEETPYLPFFLYVNKLCSFFLKEKITLYLLIRESASSTGESALTAITSDSPSPN